jgi:hypothetical protein
MSGESGGDAGSVVMAAALHVFPAFGVVQATLMGLTGGVPRLAFETWGSPGVFVGSITRTVSNLPKLDTRIGSDLDPWSGCIFIEIAHFLQDSTTHVVHFYPRGRPPVANHQNTFLLYRIRRVPSACPPAHPPARLPTHPSTQALTNPPALSLQGFLLSCSLL